MPKTARVDIFRVNIPFRTAFAHSLKKRTASESIFAKVTLENGVAGFGESLPRAYVTGRSQDSVFRELKDYAPRILGLDLNGAEDGVKIIKGLGGIEGEGRCAIEIALLDALGKACSRPISSLLGESVNTKFVFSFVISSESLVKVGLMSLFAKCKGYRFIKIKAGAANDTANVSLCRNILPAADIRIDANGVWDAAAAIKAIEGLGRFKISAVEQPTPKGDIEAMREVSLSCGRPVIADESLCTIDDALRLAQMKACGIFNVRLSKCGGIFRSLDIIRMARDYEIGCQIGCHVGESGILSAAQRHLASVVKDIRYMEGSYSRMLLKEDVIEEDLTPVNGAGYALNAPGLGVTVKEDTLHKYTQEKISL